MNRKKMTLFNYVNGVFLLLLVIVCILPILHVIALSLSERIEAVAGNVTFYPIGFTLEAYRYVMEDSQFWTSLRVKMCIRDRAGPGTWAYHHPQRRSALPLRPVRLL